MHNTDRLKIRTHKKTNNTVKDKRHCAIAVTNNNIGICSDYVLNDVICIKRVVDVSAGCKNNLGICVL